jgi:hypothetical protein
MSVYRPDNEIGNCTPLHTTTVLDTDSLVRLFSELAGRTFLGPVDGFGCVELVFDDRDDKGGNLVTIFTEGRERGRVAFGFVSNPVDYVGAV